MLGARAISFSRRWHALLRYHRPSSSAVTLVTSERTTSLTTMLSTHQARRSITTSPCLNYHQSWPICSSFHGLPLPEDDAAANTHSPSNGTVPSSIREAEVIRTDADKQQARELIAEIVRAELSAHSVSNTSKLSDGDDSGDVTAADFIALSPYERRVLQLNEAQQQHDSQFAETNDQSIEYAKSCVALGDMHYQLGQMEQSQTVYMKALKGLLGNNGEGDDDDDSSEYKLMIAQVMHCLGAVNARCGEYDEAFRWYEESLKRKRELLTDATVSTAANCPHYEMGKTLNGLAALEVMSGGIVQWEKAMTLFREAERHYLYEYQSKDQQSHDDEADNVLATSPSKYSITKENIEQMTPHRAQLIINVRSNMGELLRQRGRYDEAVGTFRLALDLAQLDVARKVNNNSEPAVLTNDPGPDERRNAIVELLVQIADNLVSAENYDEAAISYEQALRSHIMFRRLARDDDNQTIPGLQTTTLPSAIMASGSIPLDVKTATTMEAAIRNNLARTLAQIGQDKLALEHYEAALTIKRQVGGDEHIEVGHTLMGMGALLGGPMRDFSRALNCFKEALYIYRFSLETLSGVNGGDTFNYGGAAVGFYDGESAEEISEYVSNATKNIGLIEAALLGDRDGKSGRTP